MANTHVYLWALLFVVAACATSPPSAISSDLLVTKAGGFLVDVQNGKSPGVKYSMIYSIKRSLETKHFAVFKFENLDPSGAPVVIEQEIQPNDKEIGIQSPIFPGVKNNKTYRVVATLYSDATKTKMIGTHVQDVLFRMPATVLEQFGVRQY